MAKNAQIGRVIATSVKRLNAAGRKMDTLIQVVGNNTRILPPSPAKLHSEALFPVEGEDSYAVTSYSFSETVNQP